MRVYEIVTNQEGQLLWSGQVIGGKWPSPGETFDHAGRSFVVTTSSFTRGRPRIEGDTPSAFIELTVILADGETPRATPGMLLSQFVMNHAPFVLGDEALRVIDAMIAQRTGEHFERLMGAAFLSGSATIGGPEFVRQQEQRYRKEGE